MSLHDFDWGDGENRSAIDRAERSLLGTCILVPYLLDRAALLRPSDFRNPLRGRILDVMREFPKRRFDACLLAVEMEKRKINPPNEFGWIAAIGELMDHAVPEDEVVSDYVRVIKEAAILRRQEAFK